MLSSLKLLTGAIQILLYSSPNTFQHSVQNQRDVVSLDQILCSLWCSPVLCDISHFLIICVCRCFVLALETNNIRFTTNCPDVMKIFFFI